jgi:predicted acyltransferase
MPQPARDAFAARVAGVAAALVLLGYWAVLMVVPGANGYPGDLTPEGNVGAMIDRALMAKARLYRGTWDPEGLFSTVPAIGTTLLGTLAGLWFRNAGSLPRRAVGLALGGVAATLVALIWSLAFPLNKNIWTSSYAVFTAGLGALLLSACIWLVDLRGWRRLAYPFVVLGTNAIALYVLSGLLAKMLAYVRFAQPDGTTRTLKAIVYDGFFVPLASPINASLLYAIANLLVLYVVLWVMYKRGVFLKV